MKAQWWLLIGFVLAIIVAIFALVNVSEVPVNYVFGEATLPLVLIILVAAAIGALLSVSFATYKLIGRTFEVNTLLKQLSASDKKIIELEEQLVEAHRIQNLPDNPAVEAIQREAIDAEFIEYDARDNQIKLSDSEK